MVAWTNDPEDFDNQVMNSLELVDATPDGTVTYEMFMAPNFSNLNSTSFVIANGPN